MFTFKVVPDTGEPYTLKAGTRDVLTWEKTSKGKSYTGLITEPNLVDYYKIAHLAAWRQQIFTGSLKEFEEQHDIDLAYGEEDAADDEADPTRQARSSESSSPSQSEPE
jgi:hypothetical protein